MIDSKSSPPKACDNVAVKAASVADVKALYYIMQSMEGKLGGGEGIEGLYGSITRSGMQKVLDSLAKHCHLSNSSHIVDVGAGLGRPLLHALISPGVASGYGIEIDRIKCNKAAAFLQHSVAQLVKRASGRTLSVPQIKCSSIEKIASLNPATHAYSFWEGVPVDGKCAFGHLFSRSNTLKSVAVVQRAMRGQTPAAEMEEMGFGQVVLMDSFPVSMSGSGRSFTAYIFQKPPGAIPESPEPSQPSTPVLESSRPGSADSTTTAVCLEIPTSCGTQRAQSSHDQSEGPPEIKTQTPRPVPAAKILGKPHIHTPRSTGVSGRPKRVETEDQPIGAACRLVRKLEQSIQGADVVPGGRRSSRLQEQKQKQKVSQPAASPSKPAGAGRGVRKPKSPVKQTLEAAGFRVRRNRPNMDTKLATARKSLDWKPRGLGTASDRIQD